MIELLMDNYRVEIKADNVEWTLVTTAPTLFKGIKYLQEIKLPGRVVNSQDGTVVTID